MKKRTKRPAMEYGPAWDTILQSGRDFFDHLDHEPTVDELREAWAERRSGVIADYIERFPGKRPWAYWRFDVPEGTREQAFDSSVAEVLHSLGQLTPGEIEKLPELIADQRGRIGRGLL